MMVHMIFLLLLQLFHLSLKHLPLLFIFHSFLIIIIGMSSCDSLYTFCITGKFPIITFEDYISIALKAARVVGIYPEIKNPVFINKHVSCLLHTLLLGLILPCHAILDFCENLSGHGNFHIIPL